MQAQRIIALLDEEYGAKNPEVSWLRNGLFKRERENDVTLYTCMHAQGHR